MAEPERPKAENGVLFIGAWDDSARAVALYARGIADAVLEGRANAVADVAKVAAAEGADEFVEVPEDQA